MMTGRQWWCTGGLMLALAGTSWGQKFSNWRVYRMADGLPESACVSVACSPQGKVTVRHLSLPDITQLDGYSMSVIASPENGSSRVYESPGGQLWTVVPGGLQEYRGGSWLIHPVPEIARNPGVARTRVLDPVPLLPVRHGLVIFLLPDQLMEYNADDPEHPVTRVLRKASETGLGAFNGMTSARDGGLWIAGRRGLAKLPGPLRSWKGEWQEYLVPPELQVAELQSPHEDDSGGVSVVVDSATGQTQFILYFDGQQFTSSGAGERVRQAWRGPGRTGWALSTPRLFEWTQGKPELVENEEVSARQYYDIATEPGGAFWLATSDGLFRYAPPTWVMPDLVPPMNAPVHSMAADSDNGLWFVSGPSLHVVQNGYHRGYPFPAKNRRALQAARAAFWLKQRALLLQTEEDLFRFDPVKGSFNVLFNAPSPESGGQVRRSHRVVGVQKDGNVWIASSPGMNGEPVRVQRYDGNRFEPWPDVLPLGARPSSGLSGVVGTNLLALFGAQNGDTWVSGEGGTACYHEKKWRVYSSRDKTSPEGGLWFLEMPDGKIWCATQEQVWEFDGKNWSLLRRGFDRISALVRSRDGSAWVAANSGLHRYWQGAWIQNGAEEGLPALAVRDLCEDQRGQLWAGTTRGLVAYHPDADPDPPVTTIYKLTPNGNSVPEGGPIAISFGGVDKWKYTPRERLLYSYRLDERDWTPFEERNHAPFPDLAAGKHYFQVRAMDRNGNVESRPAQLEFVVVLPWYRESRLVLTSLLGLAVALFFAGVAFNRHRRLLRSYAEVERKVAERTAQLERANLELFHSQKMNALGTLAAGIAHDFNNILSIIKGSAQLIEDNLENPEKVRIRTDRINTVVEQGAGIVKAMLGFTRESEQQRCACSVNDIVQDTVRLLGDRFLREVRVDFKPQPGLPPVEVSKDFVQQVLLNFIFNAEESMDHDKRIVLSASPLERLPSGLVLAPEPANAAGKGLAGNHEAVTFVALSVRDFGCGIPPQNQQRIFEPFFTTKAFSARRGTGLGLSMVYELAKKMGAGLRVESTVGQGSTFTLILPANRIEALAGQSTGSEVIDSQASSRTSPVSLPLKSNPDPQ